MDSITKKILEAPEKCRNHPILNVYLSKNNDCAVCKKIVHESMINSERIEKPKENDEKIGKLDNSYNLSEPEKFFIEKLGLHYFEKLPNNILVKSSTESGNLQIIEIYFSFLRSVDLSSKSLFKCFDLEIFNLIFKCNFLDIKFQMFITQLPEDPLLYDKEDKIRVFNIHILAAVYCITNKIDCGRLMRRINEISFLFKPCYIFDLPYISNHNLEIYIIQMRKITKDYNEALLLNRVYLDIKTKKELFPFFHRRLMDCCNSIDKSYLLSFLNYTFTSNTVLFNCLTPIDIIKLIISFYNGMSKIDSTLSILELIYINISSFEVFEYVKEKIKTLGCNKPKYNKICLEIEIRDFKFMNEFKDFFVRNRESFIALNIAFNQLKTIKKYVKESKHIYELFEIVLFFFTSLKSEFIETLINQILINLIFLSDLILKEPEFNNNFLDFNMKCWSKLNDLLLFA